MAVLARALVLAGIAATTQAQMVSSPATLQTAPRITHADATQRAPLPPGAAAHDAHLRAQIPPKQLEWADRTAAQKLPPEAIRATVVSTWPDLAQADIESLVFVVMAAAARDADADLRSDMAAMRDATAEKQAQRGESQGQGAPTDSLGEQSELQSLRLQVAMDRRSKMIEALSNLMKKADDTQSLIVQNIK